MPFHKLRSSIWLGVGLLLCLGALLQVEAASAQSSIQIISQGVTYQFGQSIHFEAQFESDQPLAGGRVVFHQEGQEVLETHRVELNGSSQLSIDVQLDESSAPEAFSQVIYWFVVATQDGLVFESPEYQFTYDDNRYTWQSLEEGPFSVRWHNGDEAFAAAILSAAQKGVGRTQAILPVAEPSGVNFQIYDRADDVLQVLQLAGYPWLAGHTDPELGRILLSIPPTSQSSLEIERQVPHEVAHIMLYQALGREAYTHLPVWLNEGIASNAELYSDPLRAQLLELAFADQALLPLTALCESFPQDTATARLAYAEAASFVAYLREEYGVVGVGALVDAYGAGGDCASAPVTLFGADLAGLQAQWEQQTFSPSSGLTALLEKVPWPSILVSALIVGALLLIQRILVRRAERNRR